MSSNVNVEKERNLYYSFLFNDNKQPIKKGIKNKLIRYDAFGQKITKDKKDNECPL